MLRQRRRRAGEGRVLSSVRELDAFPKVPDTYVQPTAEGGSLSLLALLLVGWLLYAELARYLDSRLVFRFLPDTDMDAHLRLDLDLTLAMPCAGLGADILDSTSQSVFGFGELQEEDTWFELSEEQRDYFESVKHLNSYLREEYHALWNLLWKSGHGTVKSNLPPRKTKPNVPYDACRFHGTLTLNKVAGNFHITAGKSLHLPRGHIHLNMMFDDRRQNFSHRIDRLSFGDPTPGIIHPLEGDERITSDENMLFQYFVEVVPTDVETALSRTKTYQYSVKEYSRPVSHEKGSHGIPGLFIKYDVAALKIRVYQERENIVQFSLRLFCVIGGIYIIIGFFNRVLQLAKESIIRKTNPNLLASKVPVPPTSQSVQKNSLLMTPELSVPLNIVQQ